MQGQNYTFCIIRSRNKLVEPEMHGSTFAWRERASRDHVRLRKGNDDRIKHQRIIYRVEMIICANNIS